MLCRYALLRCFCVVLICDVMLCCASCLASGDRADLFVRFAMFCVDLRCDVLLCIVVR